ncbi:MAG: DegT/DnrJ/EryC1/StrS family aminotransferase [Alphaproteobacteria bacterium]
MSTSPIAFIDLKAQQKPIRERIEARLKAILDHGAYINGPEIKELEEALVARTGAADAVGVSSGTDALVIAMMGEDIGPGDAVFIPSFTYNATANAVLVCGATPVFVDVREDTFNMDPVDLRDKIDAVAEEGRLRPRAVVPVDLFGLPADYATIGAIAAEHDMIMMADAAQSFGGRAGNRAVGTLAPITGTSFFPAKTLGAYGDGGAIFTDTAERGELWRSLRWHGTDETRKLSVRVGINGRLDSMQAAVLLEKLTIFDQEIENRNRVAARYDTHLSAHMTLPARPADVQPSWGLYSITVPDRAKSQAVLKEAGIPTAIYYPVPCHKMDAFAAYAPAEGLATTERLAETILALPMHPYLSESDVDRVCETLIPTLH